MLEQLESEVTTLTEKAEQSDLKSRIIIKASNGSRFEQGYSSQAAIEFENMSIVTIGLGVHFSNFKYDF